MLKTKLPWQSYKISTDLTHHLMDDVPAYPARYTYVLKFHEPGLAPALDQKGALHINILGQPLYSNRYLRTFGFYEGRAAVQSEEGWFHILTDGTHLYSECYDWCGNYQQHRCTVRDRTGRYFHINESGEKAYPHSFAYAGDFRDSCATIQNTLGKYTHINLKGEFLHGKWFDDLDVYHKGFARAKDSSGWFHINLNGDPIYPERFKSIEPFYNGQARVETTDGALQLISESGEKIHRLRATTNDSFHQVSGDLVSYWRFYTLQTALDLTIFDLLPNTVERLSLQLSLPKKSTFRLLLALQEMGYVTQSNDWIVTHKGAFLQTHHPYSLNNGMELWKEEHLKCWQYLSHSLKTESAAFNHLYGGKGWFDWLVNQAEKSRLYHTVISRYAKRDYEQFGSIIDFSIHRSVVDIGGSSGTLLFDLLEKYPHLQGLLLDLPNVIKLSKIPPLIRQRVQLIEANFFQPWPAFKVESGILSRVLHDWPDLQAGQILQQVRRVLVDGSTSRLYIIENILNEETGSGALLDLNMLIMTGGKERTLGEFQQLLQQSGFTLEKVVPLNQVSSILVAMPG